VDPANIVREFHMNVPRPSHGREKIREVRPNAILVLEFCQAFFLDPPSSPKTTLRVKQII
jgi:hypothetical protein